jgi:hypothetical protein
LVFGVRLALTPSLFFPLEHQPQLPHPMSHQPDAPVCKEFKEYCDLAALVLLFFMLVVVASSLSKVVVDIFSILEFGYSCCGSDNDFEVLISRFSIFSNFFKFLIVYCY